MGCLKMKERCIKKFASVTCVAIAIPTVILPYIYRVIAR